MNNDTQGSTPATAESAAAVAKALDEARGPLNTYRVYAFDYRDALNPVTTIVYVRAPKYGPAWKVAGKLLAGETPSPLDGIASFYDDPECTKTVVLPTGDGVKVAAISDMKPRNVKLDAKSLQSILADPNMSDEDKVAMAVAQLGLKAATPEPATGTRKSK